MFCITAFMLPTFRARSTEYNPKLCITHWKTFVGNWLRNLYYICRGCYRFLESGPSASTVICNVSRLSLCPWNIIFAFAFGTCQTVSGVSWYHQSTSQIVKKYQFSYTLRRKHNDTCSRSTLIKCTNCETKIFLVISHLLLFLTRIVVNRKICK